MGNPRNIIVGLLLISTPATVARAQALQQVEVGGGVGAGASWGDAADLAHDVLARRSPVGGGDVRITVPLNECFAVEGLIAFLAGGDKTTGVYGVQVKRRLRLLPVGARAAAGVSVPLEHIK